MPNPRTVLHYTGADDDRGGVMSAIRALASAKQFECVLGVNPGFAQSRTPPLQTFEFPAIAGEVIGLRSLWRARTVAGAARLWLREDPQRIFHAHSRAGLLVALWLARAGERRMIASVHCFGRQRWFYRWAARQLDPRLFWLSPAMKRYYALGEDSWQQCLPSCLPAGASTLSVDRPPRPDGSLRLGGIGALVAWKGWHLVIEALAGLPAEVRARTTFRHIGSAGNSIESKRYAESLRALAESRGLGNAITWLGEQPSSAALLRDLDCLVVPSDQEPFSLATLEALAMGIPVLASDVGGPNDLIAADETGWFFRNGDAFDLRRAIQALATTDALARVRITPDAVRPFLAPAVAGRWEQIYAGLTELHTVS